MKFGKVALAAALVAGTSVVASAQDAGTVVYGNDDAPVGTITSNVDGIVTLDTGSYKVPLPADLLAEREIGWTANTTKADLNAMMAADEAEAEAKMDAALIVGAEVMSADGMPAGKIHLVDKDLDQYILMRDDGIITLKREFFAFGENDVLMVRITEEQIAANVTEVPEGAVIQTAGSASDGTSGG